MGLMEFLRKSREAEKLAAVLKSNQLEGQEKDARTIRRTLRVYRKVAFCTNCGESETRHLTAGTKKSGS